MRLLISRHDEDIIKTGKIGEKTVIVELYDSEDCENFMNEFWTPSDEFFHFVVKQFKIRKEIIRINFETKEVFNIKTFEDLEKWYDDNFIRFRYYSEHKIFATIKDFKL